MIVKVATANRENLKSEERDVVEKLGDIRTTPADRFSNKRHSASART
jgi:hypothetical protein